MPGLMRVGKVGGIGHALSKGVGDAFAFPGSAAYLGVVATRAFVADSINTTYKQANARTGHFARDAITSLQLLFFDFYVVSNGQAETPSGSDTTISAALEYPAGTFTRVQFSASDSGTVTSGGLLLSDAVAVSIPRGANFWIWQFRRNASGIIYNVYHDANSSLGDISQLAVSGLTDQSMGGTITSNFSKRCIPPLVLAQTKRPSIAFIGDSKMSGVYDDQSRVSGDLGEGAGPLGGTFAYVNLAISGDRAAYFSTVKAKRLALATYCSHVVSNYGINDVRASRTAQQIKDDLQTVWSRFHVPVFQMSIPPATATTASTDGWTTLAGQTVEATNAVRQAINTWLAGTPDNIAGMFDIASVLESAAEPGKWLPGLTNDGLHESPAGIDALIASGVVAQSRFSRPDDESLLSHAQLYVKYMTVKPNDAAAALYETCCASLVSAGLWDKIEYVHIFGQHDHQAGQLNLKDPRRYKAYRRNNVVFTAQQGFSSPDGGDLGSGFIPSVDGTLYLKDSASLFAWSVTNSRVNAALIAGRYNSGGFAYINPWNLSTDAVGHGMNDGTGANAIAPGSAAGLFHLSRQDSSGYALYRNGVPLGTQVRTSTAVPTADLRALSGGSLPSTRVCWCVGAGAGMDATDAANLYSILNDLKSGLAAL